MIKSNPYKVGNWVNLVIDGVVRNRLQICHIDADYGACTEDHYTTTEDGLKPIAVTDKVLAAFGFQNLHGNMWSKTVNEPGTPISVEFGSDVWEGYLHLWIGKVKVRSFKELYLHTLQNIAADLCDIELELINK